MTTFENKTPSLHERELERERRNKDRGEERSKKARAKQIKRSGLSSTKASEKLVDEVIDRVVAEIERRIAEQEKQRDNKKQWYEDVKDTNLYVLAETALIVCLDAVGRVAHLNSVLAPVGRAVQMTKFTEAMRRNHDGRKALTAMENRAKGKHGRYLDRIEYVRWIAEKNGYEEYEDWSENRLRYVGSFLVDCIQIASGIITVEGIPESKKTKKGFVTAHPKHLVFTDEAREFMERENLRTDALSSWFGPMLTKPNRWPSINGPYHDHRVHGLVPMIKKLWSPEQKQAVEEAITNRTMDNCIEALNRLQDVPLKVNSYVVDAVEWVDKEKLGHKVEGFPELDWDDPPERIEDDVWKEYTREQKADWYARRDEASKDKLEAMANLAGIDTNLGESKDLSEDEFHLPHQFDTRGRIYHTSAFGHHNTDYVRAMFLFANETEIGEKGGKGQFNLAIQIANAWGDGVDKESYAKRYKWVDENLEWIVDCGDDFKATFDRWREADEPFQFLAAARELRNWFKYGPAYKSGLPVSIDATQSGVQHYSCASLSDVDGPKVNLCPSSIDDKPADLYQSVVMIANTIIEDDIVWLRDQLTNEPERSGEGIYSYVEAWHYHRDYERANPPSEEEEREKFEKRLASAEAIKAWGGVTRKMAKSPTMTWCYSSRQFGFMRTLRKKYFKDIKRKLKNNTLTHPETGEKVTDNPFGEDEGFNASIYLADVFEIAIARAVSSAAEGMKFLQRCAEILQAENIHFAFTTKLGFPMFQYYRPVAKNKGRPPIVFTERKGAKPLPGAKASVTKYEDAVRMPKSVNAVSPNVIHAMDATHLMMTVLHCADQGVTDMLVVHDSFSTTIGNVDELSICAREALIDLYDGYCLYEDVLNQCRARHPDPDNTQKQLRVQQLETQLELETDEEKIEDLMAQIAAVKERFVSWPQIPAKGSLDLEDIMRSEYCLS